MVMRIAHLCLLTPLDSKIILIARIAKLVKRFRNILLLFDLHNVLWTNGYRQLALRHFIFCAERDDYH